MKKSIIIKSKTMRIYFLCVLLALFSNSITIKAQCPGQVDLFVNSFNPAVGTITVGQTTQVIADMGNLGPCDIPIGEATMSITLSATYLNLGTPLNFNGCSAWAITNIVSNGTQHNLFFSNTLAPLLAGSTCEVTFDIKGKATVINSPISINSSLSLTANSFEIATGNNTVNPPPAITVTVPLAIKFSNFEASIKDCNAVLNWKTSSEENFDRFEIEYSTDSRLFTKVGSVAGKNVSASITNYQFTYNQQNAKGYYRLKMIDKDGKINYSKVIPLTNSCSDAFANIYPMPVNSNQLAILTLKNLKGKIAGEMYSLDGKLISNYIFNNGSNSISVNKLPAGNYYLKVKDAVGFTQSLKVIVVRGQ
jgi:hypothetical protein